MSLSANVGDVAVTDAGSRGLLTLRPDRTTGTFTPRGVDIRLDRLLGIMGYRHDRTASPVVRRTAAAMAELAATAMAPVVHYRRVAIRSCDHDQLVLGADTTFRSPAFSKYLAGCREIIAFVLTLGGRFDGTQTNLVKSDKLLEAVMLENAGWIGIEEVTRLFALQLGVQLKTENLALSRRLAPGYAFRLDGRKVEWRLEDQKPLFALFADAAMPVELLESCAMKPKMSRTGLYGLRPLRPGHEC